MEVKPRRSCVMQDQPVAGRDAHVPHPECDGGRVCSGGVPAARRQRGACRAVVLGADLRHHRVRRPEQRRLNGAQLCRRCRLFQSWCPTIQQTLVMASDTHPASCIWNRSSVDLMKSLGSRGRRWRWSVNGQRRCAKATLLHWPPLTQASVS